LILALFRFVLNLVFYRQREETRRTEQQKLSSGPVDSKFNGGEEFVSSKTQSSYSTFGGYGPRGGPPSFIKGNRYPLSPTLSHHHPGGSSLSPTAMPTSHSLHHKSGFSPRHKRHSYYTPFGGTVPGANTTSSTTITNNNGPTMGVGGSNLTAAPSSPPNSSGVGGTNNAGNGLSGRSDRGSMQPLSPPSVLPNVHPAQVLLLCVCVQSFLSCVGIFCSCAVTWTWPTRTPQWHLPSLWCCANRYVRFFCVVKGLRTQMQL
jgi:hypothetical protein